MKNRLMLFAAGTIVMNLFACSLMAQDTTYKTLPAITITAASNVTKEVNKAFTSTFPEAQNPTWYKMNKNYLVKFITSDQKNQALFAKKGQLIYHIRYGHEQNLPEDVHKIVKSTYYDYNITTVAYVNQDDRKIWVVNLENAKKIVLVRVEEGQLEEVETLNRS